MQEEQVAGLLPGIDMHHRLAAIADIPAEGDALVMVLAAALIVFVLLLLTDILGLTRIFSFARSARR